ncbi:hypothetical protein E4K10_09730 [Streptomyces sp. T1317-0309]|nr:hypothetical protein E4K10_09730 [Streptomyces sp. T1317-0309]
MRVERQVLGHQRRRESGRPFWSTRPFGFERDGAHREEEAEALRQAYRDIPAGVSMWSIAKDLNARELLSPHGKAWRSSNLRGVLLKPRNAGIQTYPSGSRSRMGGAYERPKKPAPATGSRSSPRACSGPWRAT